MKQEKIKPIPKYMIDKIRKYDIKAHKAQDGFVRFYSYLTKNDGELVKVTVAVKCRRKKWYCKQVAVHGVHSDICHLKDIVFYYMGSYVVGWHAEGLTKEPKWYEEGWGYNDDKYFDPYAPCMNPEYALRFPEYKYSAIDRYPYGTVLQYLRMYEKYPHTEYLVKLGLAHLTEKKMILDQCVKSKAFCKWIFKQANDLRDGHYDVQTILKAFKTGRTLASVQTENNMQKKISHEGDYKELRKAFLGRLPTLYRYLLDKDIQPRTYLDYFKACRYLELDMTEAKNAFPPDFARWHDIRVDEYHTKQAEEDARRREDLYHRFAEVAEKYAALGQESNENYIVIIARSPAELIREGDTLHHCVGRMGYDQRFARAETLIFFVRAKTQPDAPFVTVEYSLGSKRILQCHGEHNAPPEKALEEYLYKRWLPYANRKLKKIA